MTVFKKILSILLIASLVVCVLAAGSVPASAAGTGVGLAEWAMRAYNESWAYVWGGASVGAVDCSGLIWMYCGGDRTGMLADAQANGREWGYVSSGVPNIHGLGLSRPNHVGVYVGNGMEVDARGSDYGVCYQAVGDRWECWFKLTAVTYPTTGWQQFCGDYYYYENGEYVVNTTRTIDGVTYYFDQTGASSTVPASAAGADDSADTTADSTDSEYLMNGSTGEQVEKLQARLYALGYYNGAIDGDFGSKTEEAFKLFQKQVGLNEDGIAGADTQYLYADDAPAYSPIVATGARRMSEEIPVKTDDVIIDGESDTDADQDSDEAPIAAQPDSKHYAKGDSGDMIVTIQQQLIKLGYLEGAADGSFGSKTETAVRLFQTANDLDDTGVIDDDTYASLFSEDAAQSPTEGEAEPAAPTVASGIAATTAKDNTVERGNTSLSQKSVAVISDSVSASRASATNLDFLLWLAIMIAVMLVAFVTVFSVEKKRSRAMAHAGRRFQ